LKRNLALVTPVRFRFRGLFQSFSSDKIPGRFRTLCCAFLAHILFVAFALSGCSHHKYVQPQPAPIPAAPPATTVPKKSAATTPQPPASSSGYSEEGVASWYGEPFQGHRTSNGEIYDMYLFTAAHRTLPFGAVLRVTNMRNGKQTEVRINDRGPFVANRVIDLSLSAARAIDMVGPGTAQVRLEMISGPNPSIGSFGVQVGAFLVQENAGNLRDRLAANFSPVNVVPYDSPNGVFYRVRVGHARTEQEADQIAEQLRQTGQMNIFVVRLDN
jgi:rare lipoprotein A